MADVFNKTKRSRVMAAIKSTGNKDTELKLIAIFRANGIAGWRRNQKLPGKPDFVFRRERLAVFVDGCFWHGCRWHCRMPKSRIGFDVPHGQALNRRLKKHSDSISAVQNLELGDFRCRWLVVDEVFIPLGESLLISHYKPLWNAVVDGFGNHAPGRGRAKGKKPMWDVLHPGRRWAEKLKAACTAEKVLSLIEEFLTSFTVPTDDIAL
jgi:DNA mismatch endonuclease Vsr